MTCNNMQYAEKINLKLIKNLNLSMVNANYCNDNHILFNI